MLNNTYVYVLIGYHDKKKIRIDGFHGDYLTVSFCEGLDTAVGSVNTVTAIRGFLYAVLKAQADILWAQAKPTVSHACRLRAPKGGGDPVALLPAGVLQPGISPEHLLSKQTKAFV